MNETWNQEPIGPQLYGSGIFGDFYYGSAEWTGETTTSATWTNLTDASLTWSEESFIGIFTNTVVASAGIRVVSSEIQNDSGDGATGGYHGNFLNSGNTAVADKINICLRHPIIHNLEMAVYLYLLSNLSENF